MIWSSVLKRSSLSLGAIALTVLTAGCGDKVNVKEAANDDLREIVWADSGMSVKLGDDLTLTKVIVSRETARVFKQTDGNAGDSRPRYAIEFWGRYDNTGRGDSRVDAPTSVERYGRIGGLLSDAAGNLYVDGWEPGTVIDNPANTAADGEVYRAIDHWTIATNTALIAKFNWVQMVTNTVTTGATTVDAIDLGDLFQIGNKEAGKDKKLNPLVANVFFDFNGNYDDDSNDSIYSVNKDYTTYKAKAACILQPFDDTTAANQSAVTTATLATAELNLGRNLIDEDGQIGAAGVAGSTGQQTLVVNWRVRYHLAGFNWATGKMNWYRTKSAKSWQNRELPNVDASTGAASPSGLEDLIRECNAAAGVNDKWSIVTRNTLGEAGSAQFGASQATHCAGLKADADKSKWPLQNFNNTLAAPVYDCTANFAGLVAAGTGVVQQGDWQVVTGNMGHTGRVTDGVPGNGSDPVDLVDVDTSDIAETAL